MTNKWRCTFAACIEGNQVQGRARLSVWRLRRPDESEGTGALPAIRPLAPKPGARRRAAVVPPIGLSTCCARRRADAAVIPKRNGDFDVLVNAAAPPRRPWCGGIIGGRYHTCIQWPAGAQLAALMASGRR
jgi:hypothetical protein